MSDHQRTGYEEAAAKLVTAAEGLRVYKEVWRTCAADAGRSIAGSVHVMC